ncbi:MAG: hypothetical protein H6654_00555 [Ardenticatenaceae bacterium]|nr:hypothetical protein [Ardenticatenaceae bacterium]
MNFFTRLRLPLITGYLFTGLLVGVFVLGFASQESLEQLRFVDEISLAFIAFLRPGGSCICQNCVAVCAALVW